MKLKRFYAPDIRQAINKVRSELGPDAVILSNRSIDDGVELIAAMDYDDALIDEQASSQQAETAHTRQAKAFSPQSTESTSHKTKEPFWKQTKNKVSENTEVKTNTQQRLKEEPAPSSLSEDDKRTLDWLAKFNAAEEEQSMESGASVMPERSIHSASNASPKHTASSSNDDCKHYDELRNELHAMRGLLEQQLSSFAWGELGKKQPHRAKAMRHMLELGISPKMCRWLLDQVTEEKSFEAIWKKALTLFAGRIPLIQDDVLSKGGVFALVGPTGVGKTTTLAKMAARFALQHGTNGIALITTDNYRVGAQEQLRTYGSILETPVHVANDADELKRILKSLYDKKLVLIDTAGMSQRDMRLSEQFAMLREGTSLIQTYLVMTASTQRTVLEETVEAYRKVVLDGCMFTKLDESSSFGGALSVAAEHQLPIAYISDGQRVPEDLHRESAVKLVKRSINMMQRAKHHLDDDIVEMAYGELVANDVS